MTKQELLQVLEVLNKIKPENARVEEAKCSVLRDIERRKQQTKAMQDMNRCDWSVDFG